MCRAYGLTADDAQAVIAYGLARLGRDFDERQILDMLRFFLPYPLLPRRWRSRLFSARPGASTQEICSTFLVKVFHSVGYPILPQLSLGSDGQPVRHHRNVRLIAVLRNRQISAFRRGRRRLSGTAKTVRSARCR